MTTWPAPPELTPEQRRELLEPFGRAWRKVIDAFERKLESMSDEELEQAVEACRAGRWHHDISGDTYAASFEIERQARAMLIRRKALNRKAK